MRDRGHGGWAGRARLLAAVLLLPLLALPGVYAHTTPTAPAPTVALHGMSGPAGVGAAHPSQSPSHPIDPVRSGAGPEGAPAHRSPLLPPGLPLSLAPGAAGASAPLSSVTPGGALPPAAWQPADAPAPRYGSMMAYDPDLGATVVFGGASFSGGVNGDTWTYNDLTGGWTELFPTNSPEPRAYGSMAYDATDHLVILYGGWDGSTVFGDTWGLTPSGSWLNLTPTWQTPMNDPTPRLWETLAQSPTAGVLLNGGMDQTSGGWADAGDTWQFTVATGWTELCLFGSCGPTTPNPVYAATMAYDSAGNMDVLFGGVLANGAYSNATWIYNATGWLNESYLLNPSPQPRAFASSAMVGGQVGVFGGFATINGNGYEMSDGWLFTPPAPTPSWSVGNGLVFGGWLFSATYDPVSSTVLVWGGFNDTWGTLAAVQGATGGGSFVPMNGPPATGPAFELRMPMAYDAADGYVLAFANAASANFPVTWSYMAGRWTNITPATLTGSNSPPALVGSSMAYDPADGEVVLFGGQLLTSGLLYSSTWTFKAGVWSNVTSGTSPPGLLLASLAPEGPNQPLVLFGGEDRNNVPYQETWVFSAGSWTLESPATSPPARESAAMVEDPQVGGALLYGGYGPSATLLDDTWRYDYRNTTWVEICGPTCTGTSLFYPTVGFDPRDNLTVLVAGQTGFAWTFTGSTWSPFFTIPSPEIRYFASMTWDGAPSDGYLLLYGGAIGFFGWTDTWTLEPLLTAGAPVLSRTSMDAVEQNLTLSAPVVGGGTSPSVEDWENLPSGCAGLQGTSITCTPNATSAGTYATFNLAATTNGVPTATGSAVQLTVDPPLALAPVPQANQSSGTVGGEVTFWANASGGSGLYADQWHGLGGLACMGAGETVSCQMGTAGNYSISLTVSDSNGVSLTTGTLVFTVRGPLAVTGPFLAPNPLVLGGTLSAKVVVNGGSATRTFAWTGLPPGCGSTSSPTLTCTPTAPGNFGVEVFVNDSLGDQAVSAVAALSVLPTPSPITLTVSASPPSGPAPLTVAFNVSAQGGSPPLIFGWTFGDGGRGAGLSPTHTYASSGTYVATLWVNDSTGQSASTTVTVTVGAGALSASLVVSPGQIALGQAVTFNATVVGGEAPFTFLWNGLPQGCASSTSHLTCTPTQAGSYAVVLTVSAGGGAVTTARATLVVSSPSALTGAPLAGFPLWELEVLGGVLVAGLVVALLSTLRRRPRSPTPAPTAESPAPATPSSTRSPESDVEGTAATAPPTEQSAPPSSSPASPPSPPLPQVGDASH